MAVYSVHSSYLIPHHHFPIKLFAEVPFHVLKQLLFISILGLLTLSPPGSDAGSNLPEGGLLSPLATWFNAGLCVR